MKRPAFGMVCLVLLSGVAGCGVQPGTDRSGFNAFRVQYVPGFIAPHTRIDRAAVQRTGAVSYHLTVERLIVDSSGSRTETTDRDLTPAEVIEILGIFKSV